MAVVTALHAAPGGRVAVYVDGSLACQAGPSLVARWRLCEGRELDSVALAGLCRDASTEAVVTDAYRLLGHRARSREELRRRLLQKGHAEDAVLDALERLTADGLLDDAAFARAYITDKRELGGWGAVRIRRGLLALGVEPAAVEAALAAAAGGEGEELERATDLLCRKLALRMPADDSDRRRAYDLLLRRGFPSDVAYAAVRRWAQAGAPGDIG